MFLHKEHGIDTRVQLEKKRYEVQEARGVVEQLQGRVGRLQGENSELGAVKTKLEESNSEVCALSRFPSPCKDHGTNTRLQLEKKRYEAQRLFGEREQLFMALEQWKDHCTRIETAHVEQQNVSRVEVSYESRPVCDYNH